MSDPGFDASALASAKEVFNKYSQNAPPPNVFQIGDSVGETGSIRSRFPVQLGTTDQEDAKFSLRTQLVDGEGKVPGQGIAVADDSYFNYMERKREQANMFEFMKYIMTQADLSKPESADWWFRKFPWMQELRLKEINRQSEIQKKLATIQVTGPQSQDDFMLLFLKEKNLLGDVNTPVQHLNDKNLVDQSNNQFIPGMFSFFSRKDRLLVSLDPAHAKTDWANPLAAFGNVPQGKLPISLNQFPTLTQFGQGRMVTEGVGQEKTGQWTYQNP